MRTPRALPIEEGTPTGVNVVGYGELIEREAEAQNCRRELRRQHLEVHRGRYSRPRVGVVERDLALADGRLLMLHAETIKAEAAERMALIHTRCGLRLCP